MKHLYLALALGLFSVSAMGSHATGNAKFTLNDGVRKAQCHVNSQELDDSIALAPTDENGLKIVEVDCLNTIKEAFDDGFTNFWRQELSD